MGPRPLSGAPIEGHSVGMTRTQHQTDHHLKTAITDELAWTPTVNADRIGVALTDGAVTLSGQVQTFPEKEAALRAAMRVRGVTAVADEIVVQHGAWGVREDVDIAREAGIAFDQSVVVPSGSVKAAVHDHMITLTGTVDWQYQREAARRAVAELPGVSGVRNTITLKPRIEVSPADAKKKITAALVRNAQLDAQHVHVEVTGSEVRLTGTVSSWAEYRQAQHAAWYAPGVTHVDNRLTVRV